MIVDPIYDNARLYRIRKETEDIKMEKKDIDWSNLSFGYQETDYSYVSNYKDGKWDDGQLTKDHTVTLNECAGVFQYAQTCFEGLKAYTTEDGRIVCFRPDLNAQRLKDSCERLEMPVFPEDRFVKAVEDKKIGIFNKIFVIQTGISKSDQFIESPLIMIAVPDTPPVTICIGS